MAKRVLNIFLSLAKTCIDQNPRRILQQEKNEKKIHLINILGTNLGPRRKEGGWWGNTENPYRDCILILKDRKL